jgi:hypothetical protein
VHFTELLLALIFLLNIAVEVIEHLVFDQIVVFYRTFDGLNFGLDLGGSNIIPDMDLQLRHQYLDFRFVFAIQRVNLTDTLLYLPMILKILHQYI